MLYVNGFAMAAAIPFVKYFEYFEDFLKSKSEPILKPIDLFLCLQFYLNFVAFDLERKHYCYTLFQPIQDQGCLCRCVCIVAEWKIYL